MTKEDKRNEFQALTDMVNNPEVSNKQMKEAVLKSLILSNDITNPA